MSQMKRQLAYAVVVSYWTWQCLDPKLQAPLFGLERVPSCPRSFRAPLDTSAFSMRDDFLVIIDWQPHLIRAGIGLGTEVIPRPTVVGGYSQLSA
jgi:hypothetical protein